MSDNILKAKIQELGLPEETYSEILELAADEEGMLPNMSPKLKTKKDLTLNFKGNAVTRDSALSHEIIEEMRNSGVVMFATLMKLSQIHSAFSSWRNVIVNHRNKEFANVLSENLRYIMPGMMMEAGYASLVWGFAPIELRFENKQAKYVDINSSSSKEYTVLKSPLVVDPRTVHEIAITKSGQRFRGFYQTTVNDKPSKDKDAYWGMKKIKVPYGKALVLNYNGFFGNFFGESFFKTIYPYWFWFELILTAAVRWADRMGLPFIIAQAPLNSTFETSSGNRVKALAYMGDIAESLLESNWASIPSDVDTETKQRKYSLDFMTADDRSASLQTLIQEFASLIYKAAVSAETAYTRNSGGIGSYNQAEVHQQSNSYHNQMVLMNWLNGANAHMMPLLGMYNLGMNYGPLSLQIAPIDPIQRTLFQAMLSTMPNHPAGQNALAHIDYQTLSTLADVPWLTEKEFEKKRKADQKLIEENEGYDKIIQSKNQAENLGSAVEAAQKELDTKVPITRKELENARASGAS